VFGQTHVEAGVQAVVGAQQALQLDRPAESAAAVRVEAGGDVEQARPHAEGGPGFQSDLQAFDRQRQRRATR